MKRKQPTKPRSRNPFYKELRQLGAKVLKNKKKYDRKRVKNWKICRGYIQLYLGPPLAPPTGVRVSFCFYLFFTFYITYVMIFSITLGFPPFLRHCIWAYGCTHLRACFNTTDNFWYPRIVVQAGGLAYHTALPLDHWIIQLPNHCNVVSSYCGGKKNPNTGKALGLSYREEKRLASKRDIPPCVSMFEVMAFVGTVHIHVIVPFIFGDYTTNRSRNKDR